MSRMGGSCSLQRRKNSSGDHFQNESDENQLGCCQPITRRHSIDFEVSDDAIPELYPVHDNYNLVDDGGASRSPKSLEELCVDTVCRHLVYFDGDLPQLPQDVVDNIVQSLVRHSALNATTLKKLRQCELTELSLSNCRGVKDEWLSALYNIDSDTNKKAENEKVSASENSSSRHQDLIGIEQHNSRAEDLFLNDDQIKSFTRSIPGGDSSASSYSTSSFHSAMSSQNPINSSDRPLMVSYKESQNDPPDEIMAEPEIEKSSVTSQTTTLDLRGSQRLTDIGLHYLHDLNSLRIAKLDNCHSLVGRGFRVFSCCHQLHTLSLSNCRCLTDEAITNICHLTSITALSLDGCRCLTDISLQAISHLFQLRNLDLSQCDLITDEGLEHLCTLNHLEDISLGWCRSITDKGVDILTSQPRRGGTLLNLCLARCQISDEGVAHIGRLKCLQYLDLNGCTTVKSISLARTLQDLPCLTYLDASYCNGILRSGFQGKINTLESLYLGYSGVRDSHLANLTDLPCLKELNLDSCPVGDWTLAHLVENNVVPNLTSLDLADTDVTDLGLAHLPKMKKLSHLSLFYCNISNTGLSHLSKIEGLEVLNLDSRDVGDDGLVHLSNLKHLKSLDLFSGRVTDAGCAHLSKIKTLEVLELCGGGIGNNGCAYLASLKNLRSLNLSQNERITNLGVSFLVALRNLKALNLSNTRVNVGAIPWIGKLRQLQSLALYGCNGIQDMKQISSVQSEMPTLKCLRVHASTDDDGKVRKGITTNVPQSGEVTRLQSNAYQDDDDDDSSYESDENESNIDYEEFDSEDDNDPDGDESLLSQGSGEIEDMDMQDL